MRVLFTFVGGSGHFEPLVPIARAAQAAGHTIAFTAEPWSVASVEAAGFTVFGEGAGSDYVPERLPLQSLDVEREERAIRESFARHRARKRAPGVLSLCESWRPDLLVCEEMDFGGMVAAERLGLPYASMIVLLAGGFARNELIAEPLAELRAEHGLPPDPDLAMLSRYLVLYPAPPSFRDPNFPLPATAHAIRPATLARAGADSGPPWLAELDDAPTVYFTLGTVYNMESGDLFERVLKGLRDLPINLIVTVGRHIDPAEFGPQPPNVHIEQFIPQSAILPRSDLVVSHGGSGSVIGALSQGLPSVLIPMGADQPHNAARCVALGVAQTLDVIEATPADVRAAVTTLLDDPFYRQAAERVRDEIAALPGPEHALMLLEQLAAERRPA
jgi:UDP:flavonoid glycosyltransferase YjiC (YdhE family)